MVVVWWEGAGVVVWWRMMAVCLVEDGGWTDVENGGGGLDIC